MFGIFDEKKNKNFGNIQEFDGNLKKKRKKSEKNLETLSILFKFFKTFFHKFLFFDNFSCHNYIFFWKLELEKKIFFLRNFQKIKKKIFSEKFLRKFEIFRNFKKPFKML